LSIRTLITIRGEKKEKEVGAGETRIVGTQ